MHMDSVIVAAIVLILYLRENKITFTLN
uniref:Uncharacterized protein n=1 Tax=Anguilla anguilla TaxID=7936 RepID=A0A0E9RY67_ANGAN